MHLLRRELYGVIRSCSITGTKSSDEKRSLRPVAEPSAASEYRFDTIAP